MIGQYHRARAGAGGHRQQFGAAEGTPLTVTINNVEYTTAVQPMAAGVWASRRRRLAPGLRGD